MNFNFNLLSEGKLLCHFKLLQIGSAQSLKTLKLSVYAAAKFGAKQFLKTVFESKAGRKVFNAYKDHPPLPEVIAWKYGHEETANYLEDITIRYPLLNVT